MKGRRLIASLSLLALLSSCGGNADTVSSASKSDSKTSETSSSGQKTSKTQTESSFFPSQESSFSSSEEPPFESGSAGESASEESSASESSSEPEERPAKAREPRQTSMDPTPPSNVTREEEFPSLKPGQLVDYGENCRLNGESGSYLLFQKESEGYDVYLGVNNDEGFRISRPAKTHMRYKNSSNQRKSDPVESSYSEIKITRYGVEASAELSSPGGGSLKIIDKYYVPADAEKTFNVERTLLVTSFGAKDLGFESIFALSSLDEGQNEEYFVPNCVFGEFNHPSASQNYQYWRETLLGLPMAAMRDKETGFTASIARYQPVIDYSTGSFASLSVHDGSTSSGDDASSIEVTYPSRDSARHYFDFKPSAQHVFEMSIQTSITDSYEQMMVESYKRQYALEDPRIVDVDIDDVFSIINEDFKSTVRSLQTQEVTTWGLPCEIYVESGELGSKSYQAGFTGQQIACAYHMLHYGVRENDSKSLQNGINILHFWVNDIHMMSEAGVPKIWYEGGQIRWMGYPTFLRMAIDAVEGLLDAYRLAEANDVASKEERDSWLEAVTACAEWLVSCQNSDGSWYRCYNYEGTYYKGDADADQGITWNPGDIARPTSKNNTTMPVRFLGKMHQLTGEQKYKDACLKAGEFIMNSLYPKHYYQGGTCDNPDSIDKEAGVFAMYAFDTLYLMSGEPRYLEALEEASIFTMSSVIIPSFRVLPDANDFPLASKALKWGYSDGLSYITCNGTAVDNYAAFIYYELFRTYALTGDKAYLDMAEFIQQNTKSTMDYDGAIGYKYRSLTPEASTIWSFGFHTVGTCLPWQQDANAEPISKMYDNFGEADVRAFEGVDILSLRNEIQEYGYGGGPHRDYRLSGKENA